MPATHQSHWRVHPDHYSKGYERNKSSVNDKHWTLYLREQVQQNGNECTIECVLKYFNAVWSIISIVQQYQKTSQHKFID